MTVSTAQVDKKKKFVNDHYDGKLSDGLENGAKPHDFSTYTIDHYDSKKPVAAAAGPPELAGKQAAAQIPQPKQSIAQVKFINDHYDGKLSDGLENGSKKHDFSSYTVDHYDSKKPDVKKEGKKDKGAKKDAKKGGVPPELAKAGVAKDAKKQSKAQTEERPQEELQEDAKKEEKAA